MTAAVAPTVRVQEAPFDLAVESAALTAGREDVGAVASFVGLCRADGGLDEQHGAQHHADLAGFEQQHLRPTAAHPRRFGQVREGR